MNMYRREHEVTKNAVLSLVEKACVIRVIPAHPMRRWEQIIHDVVLDLPSATRAYHCIIVLQEKHGKTTLQFMSILLSFLNCLL